MKRLIYLFLIILFGFTTVVSAIQLKVLDCMTETGIQPNGDLKSLSVGKSMTGES